MSLSSIDQTPFNLSEAGGFLTTPGRHSEAGSGELQLAIDRLSEQLDVPSMQVGPRTNDGLNVYVADGTYHFAFYERGTFAFEQVGNLDDLLYWYCESVVTRQAAKLVGIAKKDSSTNTRF